MDEDIIILRASVTTDAYGDPVEGAYEEYFTLEGKFAPSNPEEAAEVGRNAVIRGGTVYARVEEPPDIVASDRCEIRGVTYRITGEVGLWRRRSGWGVQFGVKAVSEGVPDGES